MFYYETTLSVHWYFTYTQALDPKYWDQIFMKYGLASMDYLHTSLKSVSIYRISSQ